MKAGVFHLARANFRTQITNWSVNVPQAKIVLHLPFWFVISSCYRSAMFASKLRIQRNGKTNWTAAEGVYNNSLEFPESFTTLANFRVFFKMSNYHGIFNLNMTPSSKARFMIGSCQARENGSNYVYHSSMNEENLRITVQSCFDFFSCGACTKSR